MRNLFCKEISKYVESLKDEFLSILVSEELVLQVASGNVAVGQIFKLSILVSEELVLQVT